MTFWVGLLDCANNGLVALSIEIEHWHNYGSCQYTSQHTIFTCSLISPSHLGMIPRLQLHIQLPHIRRKAIPTLLQNFPAVLSVRKAHLKPPHQICSNAPQLHHRKLLAYTIVYTRIERHERALINNCMWLLVCPALGKERQRLGKVPSVTLEAVDWHPDYDTPWDVCAIGQCEAFGWGFALDAGWDLYTY
jgi:hypothetical protein